jgi:starvation-inducible DNA-binding protein
LGWCQIGETRGRFVGHTAHHRSMTPTTKLGLAGKAHAKVAAILDHVLADELTLSATTRDFYASVTGPNFHSLHKLFEDQYRQLEGWLARLAARTRALGASGAEMPKPTQSNPPIGLPAKKMLGELMTLHEQIAARLRDDVRACSERLGDTNTAEELARLVEFHENTAWMLRMAQATSR